ncbi:MAG: hypothetical protein IJS99_02875 [Synergistaceae bacterium]|nr:hypothetical protein [Synergistaceae bacterium]
MYHSHSTEEIINEVRAQMIAGTPVYIPPEIKAVVERKTPQEIRGALSWAWREANGRN